MPTILAKSAKYSSNNRAESLVEHTKRALEVFEEIKKLITFESMDEQLIRYAILFHDFGKINRKFQQKLTGVQVDGEIKHNLLSPTFIQPVLAQANIYLSETEQTLLNKAIILHHGDFESHLQTSPTDVQTAIFHDVKTLLLENPADLLDIEQFLSEQLQQPISLVQASEALDYEYFQKYMTVEIQAHQNRYIIIKGMLNLVDHIASSIAIEQAWQYSFTTEQVDNFDFLALLRQRLNHPQLSYNQIQQTLIDPEFQRAPIVLTKAFTGGGKTIADDCLRAAKKFYLAPNRISAMSFYQQACEKYPEPMVGVLHGDISMYSSKKQKVTTSETIVIEHQKIDATRNLGLPYTLATVDQLAAAMFKYPGYEKVFAAVEQARICLDEVHLLNPRMFLIFLYFMEYCQSKLQTQFHLKTATLPKQYEQQLLTRFPGLKLNEADANDETTKLIQVQPLPKKATIVSIVQAQPQRAVLIIRNTVADAIKTYKEIRKACPNREVRCLHSRFMSQDKKAKFAEILAQNPEVIWVTTQVVEIALDIDFPVIISDLAPLEAMIQRMGRCNRHNQSEVGQFYYMPIEKITPYREEQQAKLLAETEKQLKLLANYESVTMQQRKQALEAYYELESVDGYYQKALTQAEQKIRQIFGVTQRKNELQAEDLLFAYEPYRMIADDKKQASQYFRGGDVQVEIYLLLKSEQTVTREHAISVSMANFYRLKQAGVLFQQRYVWVLDLTQKPEGVKYSHDFGLAFDFDKLKQAAALGMMF
ncbi:MAG: CRISPR-associated helicase Cas3' [Culicoidibacterales bacterium]